MSAWEGLGVPGEIQRALSNQGFTNPTLIQVLSLPPAIFHHRDIIGAAETVKLSTTLCRHFTVLSLWQGEIATLVMLHVFLITWKVCFELQVNWAGARKYQLCFLWLAWSCIEIAFYRATFAIVVLFHIRGNQSSTLRGALLKEVSIQAQVQLYCLANLFHCQRQTQILANLYLHLASALLTNFIFYQGSGKTLAFGIPILTHILSQKATQETDKVIKSNEENGITETSLVADIKSTSSDEINRPLLALIMTPTREIGFANKKSSSAGRKAYFFRGTEIILNCVIAECFAWECVVIKEILPTVPITSKEYSGESTGECFCMLWSACGVAVV